jgi:hypothetical protein
MDHLRALQILGLASGAAMPEVRKAYREQVRLWHPDRYSDGSTLKQLAQRNIQDANLAYAFLKRHLPCASPHRPQPPQRQPSDHRPIVDPNMFAGILQLLKRLMRPLKRIDTNPFREWLQKNARHPFRPWYRYPDPATARPGKPDAAPFDRILQKALGHPSAMSRLPQVPSPTEDERGSVTPVGSLSGPAKPGRT